MKKIVCDIAQLTQAHRSKIARAAEARGYSFVYCESEAAALAEAADAEILLTAIRRLSRAAKVLKWLCVPSAGVELYLSDEVYGNPEAVLTNSSGAYGVTIAEHIVMVTLQMMRRQPEYAEIVAARRWRRNLPMRSIKGSRVTLLGTGDLGTQAAKRLAAFEPASITGVNRSGRRPDGDYDRVVPISGLDDVLPDTDLLVMALPGTAETANLMDARRLSLLPEGAYLVNVGRGSTLDQAALIPLLASGRLAGAALDVFQREPIPPDDPLWSCPRLVLTPHVAGDMALPWTVERIVEMFIEDFERYCEGKPMLRTVDRSKGY